MINNISVLGSTGSIGTQTLDVVDKLGMNVCALTAAKNIELLEDQVRKYKPRLAVVFDEEKAKAFAAEHGIPKVYTDINDMLKDDEIDVVDLCLPSHMHEKFGIMVCEAKKHLLVEKPIAFEVEPAKRIYDAARKNGVRIMTESWETETEFASRPNLE